MRVAESTPPASELRSSSPSIDIQAGRLVCLALLLAILAIGSRAVAIL